MHKNDRFTFEKFSRADWKTRDVRARVCTYVPDEIFAPLLQELQARAGDILAHQASVQMAAYRYGQHTNWSWEQSLQFVRTVWDDLDPEYGAVAGYCIDQGYFQHKDVPYGESHGYMHPVSHVEVYTTGTIDDPVCAVHESGHLMAEQIACHRFRSEPAFNIAEIQGVFAQEHAYHLLAMRQESRQDALSAPLHRLQYHLGTLLTVPVYLWQLQREQAARPLAQVFADWAVPPVLAQESLFEKKTMQDLHRHPFAVMVAPVLHRLYLDAEPAQRRIMREALYGQGPDAHLPGVMSAFNIHTADDVKAVGRLAAAWLANDIARCDIGARKAYAPPVRGSLNLSLNSPT